MFAHSHIRTFEYSNILRFAHTNTNITPENNLKIKIMKNTFNILPLISLPLSVFPADGEAFLSKYPMRFESRRVERAFLRPVDFDGNGRDEFFLYDDNNEIKYFVPSDTNFAAYWQGNLHREG